MHTDYLMESDDESRRLEIKTKTSVVEDSAKRAGLVPGMRVVDASCGPGLTTSVLSAIVGESGSAVGFDMSEKRIARARELHGNERTKFFVSNFLEPMPDLGTFNFAWVRFTLEYFKEECFEIVQNISSLLEEGGILCLIDLDYNCMSHCGMNPRLETAFMSAVHQLEDKANFDPYAGRKLYSHLYRLGYEDIRVEAGAHHLIYGSLAESDRYNWGKKIEVLSRNLDIDLPGYSGPDEFYEDFMCFFQDAGRFTYTPVLSAWGHKRKRS